MGRFIRETLAAEGVDVRGVITDPERLTALAILGIRDQAQFPLLFYRENCADMALCEDDIDEGLIADTRAVVATGTHLSHPRTEAAVLKALGLARQNGARTALDIDYRPNLWGLAGHEAGGVARPRIVHHPLGNGERRRHENDDDRHHDQELGERVGAAIGACGHRYCAVLSWLVMLSPPMPPSPLESIGVPGSGSRAL